MMKQYKLFSSIILLVVQTQLYAISNTKIDELAYTFMAKNHVEGMSIAVINNNTTRIFNYGYADKAQHIPITNHTIYRIASLSKTYTATLAAVAAVENKIDLDASFNKYFPELRDDPKLNAITTSMLLGHVSSFPFDFYPIPTTYSDVIRDLKQFVPPRIPGSEYSYSNVGIGVVSYALQNIYAKNYDTLLAQKITKPLNMHSTYLHLPIEQEKYVTPGYDKNNKIKPYDRSMDVWFAATSVKSTIVDMAKFLDAQINFAHLKDSTLAKAIIIVHQNKYCFANYVACEQLGWQAHIMSELKNSTDDTFSNIDFANIKNIADITFRTQKIVTNNAFPTNDFFVDKTCSGFGISCYMAYIPNKKIGVVILLNKAITNQRIALGRLILSQEM